MSTDVPDKDRERVYRFTLEVVVQDEAQLRLAARQHAIYEGVDPADYDQTREESGVEYDLITLLDPGALVGCSVIDSSAEGIWA